MTRPKTTFSADTTGAVKRGKFTPSGKKTYSKMLDSSDTNTMAMDDFPTSPIKGTVKKNNVNPGYGKAGLDLDEPLFPNSRKTARETLNDFSTNTGFDFSTNVDRPVGETNVDAKPSHPILPSIPSGRYDTDTFTGRRPSFPNAPGGKPAGRGNNRTNGNNTAKSQRGKRMLEGIDLIGLNEHANNNEKVIKELVNK